MTKRCEICLTGNNSTLQSASAHETSKFFFWTSIVRMYNAIPGEITPCNSIYVAKMYTTVLLCALSMVFPPLVVVAWFIYNSAKKGGQS